MSEPLVSELAYASFKLKDLVVQKESKLDAISSLVKGLSKEAYSEAKVFTYYPLDLFSVTGVHLAKLFGMNVSYVRARDQTTGLITCYHSFAYYSNNYGWNPSPQPPLIIMSKATNDANLERWETRAIVTKCGDTNASRFVQSDFRPDWFDIIKEPTIDVLGGGNMV